MALELPLAGIRVIDFGGTRGVAQAAHLLAELGAEVIRLESSETRLLPVHDALWNRGKTKVALAAAPTEQAGEIATYLASADIFLHDRLPSQARALAIDPQTLSGRFSNLIHVALGAWPAGHPKEESPVDDALALAESGILDEQAAFERDGPVWLRFPLGSALAAYLVASGALARLHARTQSGIGGPVFTSLVQAALLPMMMHWTRAKKPTPSVLFGMPKASGATLFECADGSWIHTMSAPQKAPSIRKALDDMPEDVRARYNRKYADAVVKYPGLGDEWGAVEAIIRTMPPEDLLKEFWESDVPAQPVQPIGALFEDEQAIAAGYVAEGDLPGIGPVKMPGAPFHADRTESADPARASPEATRPRLPLEGVRVLDLGNFLAGPLAPMLLGDLGADVVKLEATTGDPLRPVEWAFNGCQRSKRSVAVQLKDARGRQVMERLIGWADILHHNQRMPAAEKLGFGWDAVHRFNPRAIYCHVSSYGPVGPRKDWPGYDQLFQAASGWERESAGAGNPPMWLRFGMIDHIGALASLLVTLAALVRRNRTGEGELVAASLLGASIATLDTYATGPGEIVPVPQLDQRQMGEAPARRIAQASNGWIAVSADGDADETIIALTGDRTFDAWAAGKTVSEALAALAAAGLPAAQIALNNRDAYLSDPSNRAMALSVAVVHPRYGLFETIGGAWGFGADLALSLDQPPPLLGEHSRAILSELGIDAAEQKVLFDANIVAETAA